MRIHLASTHVHRIRSVYPEISVYVLQSGNFCIRCVDARIRIFLYTLTSQYRNQSFSARALLTNPLRCPETNRLRVDGRIRFVYATCGRRYFYIRIKKFADTKISGYVWTVSFDHKSGRRLQQTTKHFFHWGTDNSRFPLRPSATATSM